MSAPPALVRGGLSVLSAEGLMLRSASPFSVVHRLAGEGRGIRGHYATVHGQSSKERTGASLLVHKHNSNQLALLSASLVL